MSSAIHLHDTGIALGMIYDARDPTSPGGASITKDEIGGAMSALGEAEPGDAPGKLSAAGLARAIDFSNDVLAGRHDKAVGPFLATFLAGARPEPLDLTRTARDAAKRGVVREAAVRAFPDTMDAPRAELATEIAIAEAPKHVQRALLGERTSAASRVTHDVVDQGADGARAPYAESHTYALRAADGGVLGYAVQARAFGEGDPTARVESARIAILGVDGRRVAELRSEPGQGIVAPEPTPAELSKGSLARLPTEAELGGQKVSLLAEYGSFQDDALRFALASAAGDVPARFRALALYGVPEGKTTAIRLAELDGAQLRRLQFKPWLDLAPDSALLGRLREYTGTLLAVAKLDVGGQPLQLKQELWGNSDM